MNFTRTDIEFISHGERCTAWMYRPESGDHFPLVIMAHGFGALRSFRLEPYAEKFARRGMAVLVFDYRGFGSSEGYPRNLISPKKHIQDWHAAIAHARRLRWIDQSKIALWGTSYSGGHVLYAAAQDRAIAAVVAQVPFVNGLSSSWNMKKTLGWGYIGRCTLAGVKDLWRAVTCRSPYYMPTVGKPGELAILSTSDCYDGYLSLVPQACRDWDITTPARSVLYLLPYSPNRVVRRITCPALIVAGERDTLIPYEFVKKTASKMPAGRFVGLPCSHFDPYSGALFEKVSDLEIEFLLEQLNVSGKK